MRRVASPLAAACLVVAGCSAFGATERDDAPVSDGGAEVDASPTEAGDGGPVVDLGPTYADVVRADAPVTYLRFGDELGSARDEVSGASATIVSQPKPKVLGALVNDPDTAFEFNGIGAVIEAPMPYQLDLTRPFTLEAWVWIEAASLSFRHVFQIGDIVGITRDSVGLYVSSAAGQGLVFERFASGDKRVAHVTRLPVANAWHHVAATFDGARLVLYLDGASVDTQEDARKHAAPLATPLTIGARARIVADTGFPGKLDEIAFYDKALPLARVVRHFDVGSGRP